MILHAGHPASESLYVVHKGGAKLAVRSLVGKQLVLDMRSEGGILGLLSVNEQRYRPPRRHHHRSHALLSHPSRGKCSA